MRPTGRQVTTWGKGANLLSNWSGAAFWQIP